MNKPKPIKPFKSLEEEAKFWDTHDVSELISNPKTSLSELPKIEKEKQSSITVRIQSSVKNRLTNAARSKGLDASTLSRMMLIEKLEEIELEQAQRIRDGQK